VIALSETRSGGTVAAFFHKVKASVFEKKEKGAEQLKGLQKRGI